ncbi:response regulator [Siccirubricoccus sp. G192]|uniref:response regulator n=1 Tax=Siccirubricoccus sp. G192 TaxID=2849651 RepID=UPI001C2C42FC|nr:response regulator [Siccirubricoccus sp. G192]MBV1800412.1 response regulator [Siccirubricoccus sp. G192]
MTGSPALFLIEDDELLQNLLEMALDDAGFEVVLASNGNQGLAELDANAVRFNAIITDIKLGKGPDGWDIGRRARELVHDMPVVYISGDSGSDWSSKGVPNSVMLAKPFAIAQLITAVSTLLNEVTIISAKNSD